MEQNYKGRRKFIKNSTLVFAGIASGSALGSLSAKSYNRVVGANEMLLVGVMGVNNRGLALATNFAKHRNAEIGYVSDVDSRASAKCVTELSKIQSKVPKEFPDFRHALEQKDMDIMINATPDHWHTPGAIIALQAGKHVYLEKPIAHNPYEGELLVAAQKKYKPLIQVGNQRRSFPNVAEGIRQLHSGIIGNIYYTKTWYNNSRATIGFGKTAPVPSWLNYDLWQGPAPRTPFKDNLIHYNWHWFWNWGTAESLANGIHMVDLALWGMQLKHPTKVTSSGGIYTLKDDRETPDTQIITLEYGDKGTIVWEGLSANGRRTEGDSVGVMFYGEKGSLFIGSGNGYKLYDLKGKVLKDVKSDIKVDPTNLFNPAGLLDSFHIQNMFSAIKNGTALNSDVFSAQISNHALALGNIALRTSQMLDINAETGKILNNKKAMRYWKRPYEKGWEPGI